MAPRGGEPAPFLGPIAYNARGQRTHEGRSSGVATTYGYDPVTFRLTALRSQRASDGVVLQDLHCVRDAVGNLVRKDNHAEQTVFFANQGVTPTETYVYDALHRLVEATGRESVTAWSDGADVAPFTGLPATEAPDAMRRYRETYAYDAVGNLLALRHQAGSQGSWTRTYDVADDSNRLRSTTRAGTGAYAHSERGAISAMPHLPAEDGPSDTVR